MPAEASNWPWVKPAGHLALDPGSGIEPSRVPNDASSQRVGYLRSGGTITLRLEAWTALAVGPNDLVTPLWFSGSAFAPVS
jgi:hypothetical protein